MCAMFGLAFCQQNILLQCSAYTCVQVLLRRQPQAVLAFMSPRHHPHSVRAVLRLAAVQRHSEAEDGLTELVAFCTRCHVHAGTNAAAELLEQLQAGGPTAGLPAQQRPQASPGSSGGCC